jgi:hypothetical protein
MESCGQSPARRRCCNPRETGLTPSFSADASRERGRTAWSEPTTPSERETRASARRSIGGDRRDSSRGPGRSDARRRRLRRLLRRGGGPGRHDRHDDQRRRLAARLERAQPHGVRGLHAKPRNRLALAGSQGGAARVPPPRRERRLAVLAVPPAAGPAARAAARIRQLYALARRPSIPPTAYETFPRPTAAGPP